MSNFRVSGKTLAVSLPITVLMMAACVLSPSPVPTDPTATKVPATPVSKATSSPTGDGGWLDWDGADGWFGEDGIAMESAPDAEYDVAAKEVAEPMPAATAAVESSQQQASLKAGMVDDNADWDDYLLYRNQYAGPPIHDRDISERYTVTVTDAQGRPLLGADVSFYADGQLVFQAPTYATGQVLFFPKALDLDPDIDAFDLIVEKDDASNQARITRAEDYHLTVELDHSGRDRDEPVALDVLFLIDATGSMADEIDKLQTSIQEIAARIDRLPTHPEVRFAMTVYRDRKDLFVTRTFDFTPDVDQFSDALAEVWADGGGDYPESLNEGLYRAVHAPEWRGDNSVKLLFLVADAPPHLDYAQDYDYAQEMQEAAQRNIKIHSIASSGLDDQGEYAFRQVAQFTQGRFIFLTYGAGGAPGEDTTHHVDDYSVENLDDLVVRLVEEELAHQE